MHFLAWFFGLLIASGILLALLPDIVKGAGKFLIDAVTKQFYTARISVLPELDDQPFFPNRTDITRVAFTLTNIGTRPMKTLKGKLRIGMHDKRGYDEEKNISDVYILDRENKQFFIIYKPMVAAIVASTDSILEAECYLTLERPNGKSHEQNDRYTYNKRDKCFEKDQS